MLGVIINTSLDWSDHISLVNQKVSKSIGILKCVKNKLSADTLCSLYFVLVHPYHEYANSVWAVRNTVILQKLFITQKRTVRIITNAPWNAHTYPIFRKKTHILTTQELHKLQVACFMLDNDLMLSYFSNVFFV